MSNNEDRDINPKPAGLNDKLNELDELLESRPEITSVQRPPLNIPVLDEIVDYNAESVLRNVLSKQPPGSERPFDPEHISREQLTTVLDQVESEIANELDSLVDILKNTIKDNLMSEIKTQLTSSQAEQTENDKNGPETS